MWFDADKNFAARLHHVQSIVRYGVGVSSSLVKEVLVSAEPSIFGVGEVTEPCLKGWRGRGSACILYTELQGVGVKATFVGEQVLQQDWKGERTLLALL